MQHLFLYSSSRFLFVVVVVPLFSFVVVAVGFVCVGFV